MIMNQMIHFVKQLSGKINPSMFTAGLSQTDAGNIAYMRYLQKELHKQDVLELPFSELKVVIFDLETTGFNPTKGDQILSIGAVKMHGDQMLTKDTFYSLIQSGNEPSREIERLTGITKNDLEQAPPIRDVLKQFYQFIGSDILVAHHANHEKSFMQHFTWSILKTSFQHRIIDTSFVTKIARPELNLVTLDECCSHFGVVNKKRHHALYDAEATAKIWAKSIQSIQRLGFNNLQDVYTYLAKF